jgi:hypothetical protein
MDFISTHVKTAIAALSAQFMRQRAFTWAEQSRIIFDFHSPDPVFFRAKFHIASAGRP